MSFRLAALGACAQLEHLDLTGCRFLTDVGLERLGSCFRSSRIPPIGQCCGSCLSCPKFRELEDIQPDEEVQELVSPGLQHLNLSGCTAVTDGGLLALLAVSLQNGSLLFLDLSGCWRLSGSTLTEIVGSFPALQPDQLSYCDMIMNGPHPTQANGCQNLNCPVRGCCISTQ